MMRRPVLWAMVAGAAFAATWFLPVGVSPPLPHGRVLGWEVFLSILTEEIHCWTVTSCGDHFWRVLLLTSALTNLVMLVGLVLLARSARHQVPQWAVTAMGCAGLLNQVYWAWPGEDTTNLGTGYWAWMGMFWLVGLLLWVQSRWHRAATV